LAEAGSAAEMVVARVVAREVAATAVDLVEVATEVGKAAAAAEAVVVELTAAG